MPSLSVDHVVVSEADGFVDIVVRLVDGGAQAVSVNYATSGGTAGASSDYTHVSGTLNFGIGETTQTVRVFLTQNATIEGYENFYFNLSNAANATIGRTESVIGIVDNDTVADTPSIVVRDVVVDERAGTATFVVMLGGPNGQASNSTVSVDYSTANGSATAGVDYTAASGTLTFAAGETVKNVVVDIANDAAPESFERFFLDLENASGATLLDAQGVAIIGASDATPVSQPRISVSDMIVGEGDGYVDIVVSLSAPGQNPVSVNYATGNETATYGADYVYTNGTLTFAVGETSKVVRVQLMDDATIENLHSFALNLSTPVNATLADNSALISIVDNDTSSVTPGLFVRDVVVDEKAGTATFVVMLGGPTGQSSNSTVTVDYSTANGSATAGVDYTAVSGTLTFAAGETVKNVVVDIADDATPERFERFFLDLEAATGATLLDAQGVAIIGASDATAVSQPRISVSDMIVGEGDGYVDIVVSLSAPGQNVVTVNYATGNETAAYGTDYNYANGTLTFAPGTTTQVVRVQLLDDVSIEDLQSFALNLSSPTNATIADASALISVVDDDSVVDTPSLFVRDVVVDEKAGTATFVVMLGGPTGQSSNSTVTVDYSTANGSATAGVDYTAVSGTLTFAAGETVKNVVVDIADDATPERFERFFLDLEAATGATLLDAQGVAIIGASDATAVSQPRISVSDMIVGEGDGYVDIVVSLSAPGQNVVTVNYATGNETAAYGTDYNYANGTLTFAPGTTTQVVRVQLLDDVSIEDLQSFALNLSSPTNATIADASALISVVDDDSVVDTPSLFVRDVVVDEKAGTATFVVMLGGPTGQSSNSTVTVDYSTANGSATAGQDYAAVSGTLTFAAGETVKNVVVDIADDTAPERFERFFLDLEDATGATLLDARGVAIIGASDATAVSQPRISVSDMIVGEGDGYVDIVVSLSAPGQNPVSVNFATGNSTAAYGSDYHYTNGTLNFAVGETTKVVRVELLDDGVAEALQAFSFNLSSASNAVIAKNSALIGVVDDDSVVDVPRMFVRDAIVDEKAGTASFVVMLGGPAGQSSNNPITVTYATSNGTATAVSDYAATSGTLTFAAGETAKTVVVDLADDAAAEALERINLTLGSVSGATVVDGRAVAEIGASDGTAVAQPSISVDDVLVAEGDGYIDVMVRLSAPGQGVVSVNYSTSSSTASYGSDFMYDTGSISFAPGETTKVVRIEILDDIDVETLQSFVFNLSGASGATIAKPTTSIGIVDNDTVGRNVYSFGRSDDVYTIVASNDVIVENLNGGTDLARSSVSYILGAHVENLTLTGSNAINGTGNSLNNVIAGNGAANTLRGEAGNDTLNGGAGADAMTGGTGNDVYTVDNAGDGITEVAGGGTDRVESSRSYILGPNLENLTLTGSAANAIGNSLNNVIIGNAVANSLNGGAGHDTLNGSTGADTMIGGTGNDTMVVDNAGDVITELVSGGTDTVLSSRSHILGAYVENLTLTGSAANAIGNSLSNVIIGNAVANALSGGNGNDTLNGGVGADTMTGGAGNDTLVIDNAGDVVIELAGGGSDTVQSNRTYTLSATLEHLTLTGSAAIDGTGNSGNNALTGNAAGNTLIGNAGNDLLNGGGGADRLRGGTGNDTYVVDHSGDIVTELAGAGTDTVQSSRNYLLGSHLENLVLIGSGAINGAGNTLNNRITGNAAANTLNGAGGNDTMIGGAGNDTYVVNAAGDVVTEAAGGGTDTVQTTINYTLDPNVERLTLLGSTALNGAGNSLANVLTGNTAANTLNGNAGNDTLNGAAGNDVLIGGAGSDRLIGGTGNDFFRFTSKSGADNVTDFVSANDTFQFSQATLRVGDGDTVREGGLVHAGFGNFSTAAEVVIFTSTVFGEINANSAASVIYAASSNYTNGADRLFVVNNGTQTGIFLFESSGSNQFVSASELTLVALVNGTTVLSDYTFTA
jgi:Ca2+-binding RTX toxin-like protein